MRTTNVLVLNDSEIEFHSIKNSHPESNVVHVNRFLRFLYNIEDVSWDIIYLDDEFSAISDPDLWTDGSGFNQNFDGLHAARALASLAEIGKCPAKKVVISSASNLAEEMFHVLSKAKVNVSLYV